MTSVSDIHRELERIARRWSASGAEAEDLVQESLLEAHTAGRSDLGAPDNRRWITGVIRNKARFAARTVLRRSRREHQWQAVQPSHEPAAESVTETSVLPFLPPALRAVARLALNGLDRREIGHLLGLSDEVLRKRLSLLRQRLARLGRELPASESGLSLNVAYGRIRATLLPILLRREGHFATHDPDGHLIVVRRR